MARVVRWTGNGGRQVTDTDDEDEIQRLLAEADDDTKNISRVNVID